MNYRLAILFAAFLASTAFAQDQQSLWERLLIPVVFEGEIAGGWESVWVSDFRVHNGADEPLAFSTEDFLCNVPTCSWVEIPPGATWKTNTWARNMPWDTPGALAYVERKLSAKAAFQLHVRDISRQALTWGTEVPVIRESEFLTRPISLLNVPLDSRFRQALRIYDVDGRGDGQVLVRLWTGGAAPVAERLVTLGVLGYNPDRYLRPYPGYAQILWVANDFPELAHASSVRIEIVPVTEELRYWAYVSVTNSETQHVTTITPQ
jgi:hypothetical protein